MNHIHPILNAADPVEKWRTAKAEGDKGRDLKSILGCVGQPLAEVLEDLLARYSISDQMHFRLVTACEESRDGLFQMVNEHRESAAEAAASEVYEMVEYLDSDSLDGELNSADSLDDAADKAFQHAAQAVANFTACNPELSDWTEL